MHLVDLIAKHLREQPPRSHFRVVDMCTGSGCIPLLFHDEFYKHSFLRSTVLDAKGYDISEKAIRLARENLALQLKRSQDHSTAHGEQRSSRLKSLREMEISHFDILAVHPVQESMQDAMNAIPSHGKGDSKTSNGSFKVARGNLPSKCDVLISNPPYISRSDYTRTTARSVRKFEPRLALVPPPSPRKHDRHDGSYDETGDLFYPHLLDLAERLSAKFVLLEVADIEQAQSVVSMILRRPSWHVDVEIWRDEPSRTGAEEAIVNDRAVNVIGEGSGRSVFIWRKDCDAFPWRSDAVKPR